MTVVRAVKETKNPEAVEEGKTLFADAVQVLCRCRGRMVKAERCWALISLPELPDSRIIVKRKRLEPTS